MRESAALELEMQWRGADLYIGAVYIGGILRVVPEGWREWEMYKEPMPTGTPEYVRFNRETARKSHESHEAKPWRGWIMTTEDGAEVGYWATESEARNHTMAIAAKMLAEQK